MILAYYNSYLFSHFGPPLVRKLYIFRIFCLLTGSFSSTLGIEDGAGVVCVEHRLQEGNRHSPGQGGQTLTESWQLSEGHREERGMRC